MRCDDAQAALSAAMDGVAPLDELAAHIEGCAPCQAYADALHRLRRRVRLVEAGPVPDLRARVVARLPAGRRREWVAAAAAFALFAVVGAAGASALRPAPVMAVPLPERLLAAQTRLESLTATLTVTEEGGAAGRRTLSGTLAYQAPESLAVRLADPGGARWAARVDVPGTSWEASAADAVGAGLVTGVVTTGLAPFAEGAALEAVLPVRSFVPAGIEEDLGRRSVGGREAVGVAVPVGQLAPLLDALRPGDGWRLLHPADRAELWVDASAFVPLEVRVVAADGEDRARWAARHGYDDAAGQVVLELRLADVRLDVPAGPGAFPAAPRGLVARDAGFADAADVDAPVPARLPDGVEAYRSGVVTLAGGQTVAVRAFTDGRAWVTVAAVAGWPADRLYGGTPDTRPVAAGGGTVYVGDGGRQVAVHAEGLELLVRGSLAPEALLRAATSLGVTALPVPEAWPGIAADLEVARAAAPWLLAPARDAGFAAPAVRVERAAVVMVLTGAGERSAVLTQLPGDVVGPPLEADVRGVTVRGHPGRWSPGRGELDWVESGAVRSLRSATLGLEELLALAEALR